MLTLLAVLALQLGAAVPAAARPASEQGWARQRAFDSRKPPPSRAERRRLRFGKKQDQPVCVASVGRQLEQLAAGHPDRVRLQKIGTAEGLPIYRVDVKATPSPGSNKMRPLRVLVAAGVHGNEPSGVAAAVKLVERALRNVGTGARYSLTVLPMVNPTGLADGTRKSRHGADLNRSFSPAAWQPESAAIRRALAGERFDLAVDLHGAARPAFFSIRAAGDGALSGRALAAMESASLLSSSNPDGRVGPYRLHSLGGATSDNPGTLKGFARTLGARYSYTLEYPRTLPPDRQVSGLFKLLRSTLDNAYRHGRWDADSSGSGRNKSRH